MVVILRVTPNRNVGHAYGLAQQQLRNNYNLETFKHVWVWLKWDFTPFSSFFELRSSNRRCFSVQRNVFIFIKNVSTSASIPDFLSKLRTAHAFIIVYYECVDKSKALTSNNKGKPCYEGTLSKDFGRLFFCRNLIVDNQIPDVLLGLYLRMHSLTVELSYNEQFRTVQNCQQSFKSEKFGSLCNQYPSVHGDQVRF